MYPVPGTVFRDATMNPQYPLRVPTGLYNSTGLYGTAGIPADRTGQFDPQMMASRPWMTGASGTGWAYPATATTGACVKQNGDNNDDNDHGSNKPTAWLLLFTCQWSTWIF